MEGSPKPHIAQKESASTGESGNESYTVESGEKVEVAWQTFEPSEKRASAEEEESPQPTVIFLPGWGLTAGSESIKDIATTFANRSNKPSLSITSRSEKKADQDYLYDEAQGISMLIKGKCLRKIVIAGYSQGGDKAVNVTELLQSDPDIGIEGLILMDSVGLYEQGTADFTKKFAKDALVNTPSNFLRSPEIIGKSMKASTEILSTMLRNMVRERAGYVSALTNEVKGMAAANPRLSELRVPIVIVSGTDDPISDPEKIMPKEAEEAIRQERIDGEYHDPREVFLKENVFIQSPYIRMLKPSKLSHHTMPLFRSESVAQTSLYMLERYKRLQKKEDPSKEQATF